ISIIIQILKNCSRYKENASFQLFTLLPPSVMILDFEDTPNICLLPDVARSIYPCKSLFLFPPLCLPPRDPFFSNTSVGHDILTLCKETTVASFSMIPETRGN